MKNLGVAEVKTYQIEREKDFKRIIAMCGRYIFNRVSDEGKMYVRADKDQYSILTSVGFNLIPVED